MSPEEKYPVNLLKEEEVLALLSPAGTDEQMDETVLLEAIADRVAELLKADPDLLFSYLYRLDIAAGDIQKALYESEPVKAERALAAVILKRQNQRVNTKRAYPQAPIEGWDSF